MAAGTWPKVPPIVNWMKLTSDDASEISENSSNSPKDSFGSFGEPGHTANSRFAGLDITEKFSGASPLSSKLDGLSPHSGGTSTASGSRLSHASLQSTVDEPPPAGASDWFATDEKWRPKPGKLSMYLSSGGKVRPGMTNPPRNPQVQKDLLEYLQSRNVHPRTERQKQHERPSSSLSKLRHAGSTLANSARRLLAIRDKSATIVPLDARRGCAAGCRRGWRSRMQDPAVTKVIHPDGSRHIGRKPGSRQSKKTFAEQLGLSSQRQLSNEDIQSSLEALRKRSVQHGMVIDSKPSEELYELGTVYCRVARSRRSKAEATTS